MEYPVITTKRTSPFDQIRKVENGQEFWCARDLQKLLDYTEWRKFEDAIERAMIACKNSGQAPSSQFVPAANLLKRGKYATQTQKDYHLSRYACYLIAMNGDPRKESVSQVQTYFAIQTHKAETLPSSQRIAIHTLTDAMRPRAMENLGNVPE